jgi:hypothetical protein
VLPARLRDEGSPSGQGMRFEHVRGGARPVSDRDEPAVQIGRVAPAPEQDVGRIALTGRQHQPADRFVGDEHTRAFAGSSCDGCARKAQVSALVVNRRRAYRIYYRI